MFGDSSTNIKNLNKVKHSANKLHIKSLGVTCHMSCVTYHLSHVICPLSPVKKQQNHYEVLGSGYGRSWPNDQSAQASGRDWRRCPGGRFLLVLQRRRSPGRLVTSLVLQCLHYTLRPEVSSAHGSRSWPMAQHTTDNRQT